jgi:phosphoribosylanthranilate isomerase
MSIGVKICGINSAAAAKAAVASGADYVGFVFYPPSPRFLTPDELVKAARPVPDHVKKVGLFVDVHDEVIAEVMERVPLDMLQLHGSETPGRVMGLRKRFGVPVMKAVKIAGEADVAEAKRFFDAADWLLFDAKAPKEMKGALPGGNALRFDWRLIAGYSWPKPWMLSGGLTAENIEEAVRLSGAKAVDVSSGVEDRPGHKSAAKIAAFLEAAKRL